MICASRVDAFHVDAEGMKVPQQQVDAALEKLFQKTTNDHPLANANSYKESKLFSTISVFASSEFACIKQSFVRKLLAVIRDQIQPLKYKMHFMLNTVCAQFIQLYDEPYDKEAHIIQELDTKIMSIIACTKKYINAFKEKLTTVISTVIRQNKKYIVDELSEKPYSDLAGHGELKLREEIFNDIKQRLVKLLLPSIQQMQSNMLVDMTSAVQALVSDNVAPLLLYWAKKYNVEFASRMKISLHWLGRVVFTFSHVFSKVVAKSQHDLIVSTYDYLSFEKAVSDVCSQFKKHVIGLCKTYERNLATEKSIIESKAANYKLLTSLTLLENTKSTWFELEKYRGVVENCCLQVSNKQLGFFDFGKVMQGLLNDELVAVKVVDSAHLKSHAKQFLHNIYNAKYATKCLLNKILDICVKVKHWLVI